MTNPIAIVNMINKELKTLIDEELELSILLDNIIKYLEREELLKFGIMDKNVYRVIRSYISKNNPNIEFIMNYVGNNEYYESSMETYHFAIVNYSDKKIVNKYMEYSTLHQMCRIDTY